MSEGGEVNKGVRTTEIGNLPILPSGLIVNSEGSFYKVTEIGGERGLEEVVPIKHENGEVGYLREVVRSHSLQALVYKDGEFVIESGKTPFGDCIVCMVNGELRQEEEVVVGCGEELILRDGSVIRIIKDEADTYTIDRTDWATSEDDKNRVRTGLLELFPGEVEDYCQKKFVEIGKGDLYNNLPKKDGEVDYNSLLKIDGIVYMLMKFNDRACKPGAERDMFYSFLLEYVYENNLEIVEVLDKVPRLLYHDKARRLDFKSKIYKIHKERGNLGEEQSLLVEMTEKASNLWNDLLSVKKEDQNDVLDRHLDDLPKETVLRIRKTCQKFYDRDYSDPEVVRLTKKYFDLYPNVVTRPFEAKVFNQYLKALLIEDEYAKLAFPVFEKGMSIHQDRMGKFTSRIFKSVGAGEIPGWYSCKPYAEELHFFFRANANNEYHGGNPGRLFLELESSEDVAAVLDHEATHLYIKSDRRKLLSGDNFRHSESVTEFVRQLYYSSEYDGDKLIVKLPEKANRESGYQKGVDLFVEMAKELGEKEFISALFNGILDYNKGFLVNPLERVKELYFVKTSKDDFFGKIESISDAAFNPYKRNQNKKKEILIEDIPEDLRNRYKDGVLWI